MKWRNCQAMVGLQLSRGSPWTSELYDDNFVWCKLAWSDPCLNVKSEVYLKLSVAGHSGSDSARWFTFFKQGVRIRSTLKCRWNGYVPMCLWKSGRHFFPATDCSRPEPICLVHVPSARFHLHSDRCNWFWPRDLGEIKLRYSSKQKGHWTYCRMGEGNL